MANTALNRTVIALMTNKSGGSVAQGDVCVVDTANAGAFTTNTAGAFATGTIVVVLEPNGIANNASGLVATGGYVPVINLSGTGSIGDLVKTHTVAKQGVRHAAPVVAGDFAEVLGTSAAPAAILWGSINQGAASATDANAVHVSTANEISGITEKTTLTGNDLFIIEDSAAAGVKKKVKQSNLGAGGAPTTTPYVTTAADAGLSAEIAIPGFAGSADILGAAGGGTSEEFDGADPFTWSANPNTFDSNTTIKSHYYVKLSGDTTTRNALKAWSPAGAFDARMKISIGFDNIASFYNMGLFICDTGATDVFLIILGISGSAGASKVAAYTMASSVLTQRGADWIGYQNQAYLRITRDGSNNATFYVSSNGLLWMKMATQALTVTVAKIGLWTNLGDANAYYAAIDWLRTSV